MKIMKCILRWTIAIAILAFLFIFFYSLIIVVTGNNKEVPEWFNYVGLFCPLLIIEICIVYFRDIKDFICDALKC